MKTILLQNSTDKLNLREGQLIVSNNGIELDRSPICATEVIQVFGNAQITTQAIKECLKEGVRINYFSAYGKYLGKIEPGFPKNVRRRMKQYQLYFDTPRRLQWAKDLIAAKIQGEIVELRKLQEQGFKFPAKELRKELKIFQHQCSKAAGIKNLLGIEGMAARIYYQVFPYILPSEISWNGRSYHPAADSLNELMSFVYGGTAAEIRQEIESLALDPHCGFLHEPGYHGGGLAYDLLEVIRAPFCDHLVFRAIRKDKEIRDFATKPLPGFLPVSVRNKISCRLRKALTVTYPTQKESVKKQIRSLAERVAYGLGQEPRFITFLPER